MWRSIAMAGVLLCGLAAEALAQGRPPPGYGQAEYDFNTRLDLRTRVDIQIDLIAAGYLNVVPNESLNTQTFSGIRRFQAERGLPETGQVDPKTRARLLADASAMYRLWHFKLVPHPQRGLPIWMPTGMGLAPRQQAENLSLIDPDGKIEVHYRHFRADLGATYQSLLEGYRNNGVKINFTTTGPDWFVISTTNPSGKDGYLRYHADTAGIIGLAVFWDNAKSNVSGERIAVLMSASLRSRMTGAPFLNPPTFDQPQIASSQLPTPPVQPSTPEPAPSPPLTVSTGSGFFVASDGSIVTNEHVVRNCGAIQVRTDKRTALPAYLVAKDRTNDLAILRTSVRPERTGALRATARLGEGVAVFGFPHSDLLATTGNFTLGNITATSGIGDDSRFYQMSAPVQSGNSGGPLLDMRGSVVGVVTSKLNALRMASNGGDLPQNVNFAVKTSLLATFLDTNGVEMRKPDGNADRLDPADLAEIARAISVHVVCRP